MKIQEVVEKFHSEIAKLETIKSEFCIKKNLNQYKKGYVKVYRGCAIEKNVYDAWVNKSVKPNILLAYLDNTKKEFNSYSTSCERVIPNRPFLFFSSSLKSCFFLFLKEKFIMHFPSFKKSSIYITYWFH